MVIINLSSQTRGIRMKQIGKFDARTNNSKSWCPLSKEKRESCPFLFINVIICNQVLFIFSQNRDDNKKESRRHLIIYELKQKLTLIHQNKVLIKKKIDTDCYKAILFQKINDTSNNWMLIMILQKDDLFNFFFAFKRRI